MKHDNINCLAILVILVQTLGCKLISNDQSSTIKTVWNEDNRVPVSEETHPFAFHTIGKLIINTTSNETWTCTANILSNQYILTANHCVRNAQTIDFQPNANQSVLIRLNPVEEGYNWGAGGVHDWAILEVTRETDRELLPAFAKLKHFSAEFLQKQIGKKNIALAGYSSDFPGLSIIEGCSIIALRPISTNDSGLVIFHDCDLDRGASGGPIYLKLNETYFLIGTSHGEAYCAGERPTPCPDNISPYESIDGGDMATWIGNYSDVLNAWVGIEGVHNTSEELFSKPLRCNSSAIEGFEFKESALKLGDHQKYCRHVDRFYPDANRCLQWRKDSHLKCLTYDGNAVWACFQGNCP